MFILLFVKQKYIHYNSFVGDINFEDVMDDERNFQYLAKHLPSAQKQG